MTARKPKTKKTIVLRRRSVIGQNIELYSSAYRIAWKQISALRRREQPDISLRLHASIRRTEPLFIASEALKDVGERSEPGTPTLRELNKVLLAPVPHPPKVPAALSEVHILEHNNYQPKNLGRESP
jgi:hypothetical protein